MTSPSLSVIVPVLDGGAPFAVCLAALDRSTFRDFELIVVDDGCVDRSVERARAAGARVISTSGREGPGAARNAGAAVASASTLLFLDADCEVAGETLRQIVDAFDADPPPDAIFGSYDASPASGTLVAQFRNLLHHWVHQGGRQTASTFWAGCGAVRRSAFERVGGFDAQRYPRPSIEDIEFGYRLREAGYVIRLCPDVQVRHHKAWRLGEMVVTDVLRRGAPWTELMLERGRLEDDLNVRPRDRVSVVAAWVGLVALLASAWRPAWAAAALASAVWLVVANRALYGFFLRRRGAWFTVRVIPLHAFYFLYAGAGFALGAMRHLIRMATRREARKLSM